LRQIISLAQKFGDGPHLADSKQKLRFQFSPDRQGKQLMMSARGG
jgi:hypothetical protein